MLIHTFKDYCAILFPKGVLIKDTHGVLIQQTEHVQSARQIRFTSVQEIVALKNTIRDYTFEACEVEDLGLKVELKKTTDYKIPEEFQSKFVNYYTKPLQVLLSLSLIGTRKINDRGTHLNTYLVRSIALQSK